MTDRAQFEAMLNALINEDQDAAKEIFHNIVVAKSREIYQELLAEDFDQETLEGSEEEPTEEGMEGEEEAPVEEMFGSEDEEGSADDEEGSADDEEGAEGGDDFGGEEEAGEEELEDRVMDLEDALEDLKAEFEALLSQEEEEGNHDMGAIDAADGDMGGDEFGGADFGGEEEVDEFAGLMEYTIKVPSPKHGDNGVNNKSAVAGKNDMGGTAGNIAQGHEEGGKGGTQGGLLNPSTKEDNAGNINVPGGKAGKSAFTKREPGHGAESKGKAEQADNKTSLIGKKVR